MTTRFARGLRRFVDSLQRSLFDEVAETPVQAVPSEPAAVGPAAAEPVAADRLLNHPHATRELSIEGRRVAFRLARVRRRSIGFVVDANGLTVRAPKWVTLRDIDAAVREKQRWILARFAEQRERAARLAATRVVWRDGATIDYLGSPLTIVVAADGELGPGETALMAWTATGAIVPTPPASAAASPGSVSVAASGTGAARLLVALPRDAGEAQIRDAVQSWLQREARRVFAERAAHFALLLGVRVTRLSLSSAATRWGSANANGSVRLHWRLIQHPLATIDYVVAHELAHLREMNHSARFWNVVRSVVPDYEAARARLRQEGRADA